MDDGVCGDSIELNLTRPSTAKTAQRVVRWSLSDIATFEELMELGVEIVNWWFKGEGEEGIGVKQGALMRRESRKENSRLRFGRWGVLLRAY